MRIYLIILIFTLHFTATSYADLRTDGANNAERLSLSLRFGIITDIHHSNQPDSNTRKYSAADEKTAYFVDAMNREKVDFIIELGDFIDQVGGGKDPLKNFKEIESIYARFKGPRYHVLGNHEFDDLKRSDLLRLLHNTGIPRGKTFYSFDHKGIHCVVLDADYTNTEPHRPFDTFAPGETPWWRWTDAWVPEAQLTWLKKDLAKSHLPTIVFSHQVLHHEKIERFTEDHTIKNADAVRSVLEADGQVLAVFSGHDHRGGVAVRNGIHYFILEGNVGIDQDWSEISPTNGLHPKKDSPFALVEINASEADQFNGRNFYRLVIKGNAQQYSYTDDIPINMTAPK